MALQTGNRSSPVRRPGKKKENCDHCAFSVPPVPCTLFGLCPRQKKDNLRPLCMLYTLYCLCSLWSLCLCSLHSLWSLTLLLAPCTTSTTRIISSCCKPAVLASFCTRYTLSSLCTLFSISCTFRNSLPLPALLSLLYSLFFLVSVLYILCLLCALSSLSSTLGMLNSYHYQHFYHFRYCVVPLYSPGPKLAPPSQRQLRP